MRPLAALLAALVLAGRCLGSDDMQHCIWRVTLRAAPEGPLEEDLWHPSASVEVRPAASGAPGRLAADPRVLRCAQDAKLSCLHDAAPPRRCAGFAWRRGGRGAAGGEYTPLSFDRVSPVRRTERRIDVYQARPARAALACFT